MPGDPQYMIMPGGGTQQGTARVDEPSTGSHFGFIFWLVLLGVVVPGLILGGLQVGGFSFVFRHR